MSGTRSPSKTAPLTDGGWKLGLLLWPFVAGAVAINVFLSGLILQASAWGTAFSPGLSAALALPLSLPATWAAVRWVRSLIRQAER